jgi:hypothetical protein
MGTQVAYAASESDYELLFWATSTNETGIYGLYVRIYPACSVLKEVADCKILQWNAAGSPSNGSFPVVIKSTPPTVV